MTTFTIPTRATIAAAGPDRSPWALPVLLSGTVMIVLDFFVVNVALPSIRTRLHAGSAALEWVVAGYGLTLAALITAGRLGDRFGRRKVVGVAVTGAIFFAAGPIGQGFVESGLQLSALLLAVAGLTRLLPARAAGA